MCRSLRPGLVTVAARLPRPADHSRCATSSTSGPQSLRDLLDQRTTVAARPPRPADHSRCATSSTSGPQSLRDLLDQRTTVAARPPRPADHRRPAPSLIRNWAAVYVAITAPSTHWR